MKVPHRSKLGPISLADTHNVPLLFIQEPRNSANVFQVHIHYILHTLSSQKPLLRPFRLGTLQPLHSWNSTVSGLLPLQSQRSSLSGPDTLLYMSHVLLADRIPAGHVLLHAVGVAGRFGRGERRAGFGDAAVETVFIEFLRSKVACQQCVKGAAWDVKVVSVVGRVGRTSMSALALWRACCWRTWSITCCFGSAMTSVSMREYRCEFREYLNIVSGAQRYVIVGYLQKRHAELSEGVAKLPAEMVRPKHLPATLTSTSPHPVLDTSTYLLQYSWVSLRERQADNESGSCLTPLPAHRIATNQIEERIAGGGRGVGPQCSVRQDTH